LSLLVKGNNHHTNYLGVFWCGFDFIIHSYKSANNLIWLFLVTWAPQKGEAPLSANQLDYCGQIPTYQPAGLVNKDGNTHLVN